MSSDGYKITLSKVVGRLFAEVAEGTTVKTVPGKTLLHTFTSGELDFPKKGDIPLYDWAFGKSNAAVAILGDNGELEVSTLQHVVQKHKATAIHAHDKFPPGQAPAMLTPASTKSFIAKGDDADETKCFIEAAKKAEKSQLMWRVKVKNNKVTPSQLVLMTKSKIVMKKTNGPVKI